MFPSFVWADEASDLRLLSSECFVNHKADLGYSKAARYCTSHAQALGLFMQHKNASGVLVSEEIDQVMVGVESKVRSHYGRTLVQYYDTGFAAHSTMDDQNWQVTRNVLWQFVRSPGVKRLSGFYLVYSVDLKNQTVKFYKRFPIRN